MIADGSEQADGSKNLAPVGTMLRSVTLLPTVRVSSSFASAFF